MLKNGQGYLIKRFWAIFVTALLFLLNGCAHTGSEKLMTQGRYLEAGKNLKKRYKMFHLQKAPTSYGFVKPILN